MAATIRHRSTTPSVQEETPRNGTTPEPPKTYRPEYLLREGVWAAVFAFYAILYSLVHVRNYTFPTPLTVATAKPGQFVEERARQHLTNITSFGSREVGSDANEIHVVRYLLDEINAIKSRSTTAHKVEVDVQRASGSFSIQFLGSFTSNYHNVQNVVVKLGPADGADHSLLVNCHYDTVLDSPGASDPAVTCCLMLEVLNVLVQSPEALPHNVIFLFNGAEENILQASHGFITQHPWAKDIRAFINLDAAGAGGRELVFQTGPNHPWLVRHYAENAPHPFASVVGQEVFQSGIIPSDTDFRIFRDFGKIPGLDIAYISNGYVYHTRFDRPEMVQPGCMQRGGENLLVLVKTLASSPQLVNPDEEETGSLIFQDFFGLFMIIYPSQLGLIFNSFTIIISLYSLITKVMSKSKRDIRGLQYAKHVIMAAFLLIVSMLVAILTSLLIGFLLDQFGQKMSWFTNSWLMAGLFSAPSVLTMLLFHSFTKKFVYKEVFNPWCLEEVYSDTYMGMLAVLLVFLTFRGINSSFMILLWVLFPYLFKKRISKHVGIEPQYDHAGFFVFHMVSMLLPSMFLLYLVYAIYLLFIPIMGRIGTDVKPDLIMAAITSFVSCICMGYQVGLIFVTRTLKKVVIVLGVMTLLALTLASFTQIGFPFRGNPAQPSRQRSFITHTDRRVHDISGKLIRKSSELTIFPLDTLKLQELRHHMPVIEKAIEAGCDTTLPYCGLPFYYPVLPMLRTTYLIPALPVDYPGADLQLINRKISRPLVERLIFNITGPNHVNLFIIMKPHVKLVRWSMGDGHPLPTQTPPGVPTTYFVYYSYGQKPDHPWQIWLEVEYEEKAEREEGAMTIAAVAHYFHRDKKDTETLRNFLAEMPDWTIPIGYPAIYDAYVF